MGRHRIEIEFECSAGVAEGIYQELHDLLSVIVPADEFYLGMTPVMPGDEIANP